MKDHTVLDFEEIADETALDRLLRASDTEILALVSSSEIETARSRIAQSIAKDRATHLWRLAAAAVIVVTLTSSIGFLASQPETVGIGVWPQFLAWSTPAPAAVPPGVAHTKGDANAFGGYVETGYGLVYGVNDEPDCQLTSIVTAAFTNRDYSAISNSTRFFANFGDDDEGFADISKNSLISGLPSTLLPYANFFVGSGNPQPLVDGNGGGILKNVGIDFKTDALTGFPKLNDTGSNAYGGAIGLQYLFSLDLQLVFEVASVQPCGIGAADAQRYFGVLYDIPLDDDWLVRADTAFPMVDYSDIEDTFGFRALLRRKF